MVRTGVGVPQSQPQPCSQLHLAATVCEATVMALVREAWIKFPAPILDLGSGQPR